MFVVIEISVVYFFVLTILNAKKGAYFWLAKSETIDKWNVPEGLGIRLLFSS